MLGSKLKRKSVEDKKTHPMGSGVVRENSPDEKETANGVKDYGKIRSLIRENPKIVGK